MNVSLNPRGLQEETHNNEGIDCDITQSFFHPVLAALFAFVSLPSLHWSLLFLSALLLSGGSKWEDWFHLHYSLICIHCAVNLDFIFMLTERVSK